jgi:integrase
MKTVTEADLKAANESLKQSDWQTGAAQEAFADALYNALLAKGDAKLLEYDHNGKELKALTWGDIDEPGGRWRVSQAVAKTRQARWVPVPDSILAAVADLVPREDRDLTGQVFAGFGADRLRTAITRACKAAAIPAFSTHDLRHRPATLWHLGGIPVVGAAAWLGHSPGEHLKTCAHATLVDRSELVYSFLLRSSGSRVSVPG